MHYYQHHIGDFLKDAGHLSNEQMGIYLRMIWRYYLDEKPLEDDCESIAFAMRSDEKTVRLILRHFFVFQDGFWYHKRCDAEISRYHGKSQKARNSAIARWENANALRTQTECSANATKNDANQEPITNNHKPIEEGTNVPVGKPDKLPRCDKQAIVDLYHEVLPELPRVRLMNSQRERAIAGLWKFVLTSKRADGQPRAQDEAGAMEWIRAYFTRARSNDFLMGKGSRASGHEGWVCDFDFLLTEKGKKQVIEKTQEVNHG